MRFMAGESVYALSTDYGVPREAVLYALAFEASYGTPRVRRILKAKRIVPFER